MAWDLDKQDELYLYIANILVTILSFVGSLWTIYFCLKVGSRKTVSLNYILAITIAGLIYTGTNLMSAFDKDSWQELCFLEGFTREFSLQCTLFFSSCLALLCYKTTKHGAGFDQDFFFKISLVLGSIISFCVNMTAFTGGFMSYTSKGLYCHLSASLSHDEPEEDQKWRRNIISLLYFGIPVISGITVTMTAYLLMLREIKSFQRGPLEDSSIKPNRLFLYPMIQFLTFVPRFMDSVFPLKDHQTLKFYLRLVHIVSTHSIGLINAAAYGYLMKTHYQKYLREQNQSHRLSIYLSESRILGESQERKTESRSSEERKKSRNEIRYI